MRFVWPAQRYDALTSGAKVTGAVITATIGVALSLPIVSVYRAASRGPSAPPESRGEHVTFVQPAAAPMSASGRAGLPRTSAPGTPARRDNVLEGDTSSLTTRAVNAPAAAGTPAVVSGFELTPTPTVVGPTATPVGFSRATTLTKTQRDSALSQLAQSIPAFPWLPPTKEELDRGARELSRRAAEARDQHRPMAVPLSSVSVTLPFGPSRQQRRRDSIINGDNLRRLARLAERARAKHDSILRANALAALGRDTTHPRSDGSRLRKRDSVPNE